MTTYALVVLYAPHSKHLIQSADLVPDLRACLNYSCGEMYAYLLNSMLLSLTSKTAYANWGFISENVAGNSEIVMIQYNQFRVCGVPVRLQTPSLPHVYRLKLLESFSGYRP